MNEITLDVKRAKTTIDRNIYGHFSEHLGRCIYEGYWVGEESPIPNVRGIRSDVIAALRKIKVPVMRWPGGCFADEYHWMDGIGPREQRPAMINTHWGGVVENNHFGTHEFMDLCEQLGCEPYICGNVGSGTVQEMSQWVEYVTFDGKSPMADLRGANGRSEPWKLKYFGVGNENWGCGGRMRPEYYADLYRRYATYARNYGENRLYRIACGARNDDYHWTDVLMEEAGSDQLFGGPYMDGLALHYYTQVKRLPDGTREGSATVFGEDAWIEIIAKALFMDELVRKHSTIMDKYDPAKKVAMIVDEWGTWYAVEPGTHPRFLYQQNSMRDALVAAVSLDIFNNHCRPGAHGQHCADGQRAAGDGADTRREDAAHPQLSRVRPVRRTPGRHAGSHRRAERTLRTRRVRDTGRFGVSIGRGRRQAAPHAEQRQPARGHHGASLCAWSASG